MRYAILISNGTLSSHFNNCDKFAFIDVDEANKLIKKLQFEPRPEYEAELLPKFLSDKGVHVVIVSDMSDKIRYLLRHNNIKVAFSLHRNDPMNVICDYLVGGSNHNNSTCDQ
jgi:predicted Fe-Mo cluster-binding NifX family protein